MPVARPDQTPEPASSGSDTQDTGSSNAPSDEETVRRAKRQIRNESRPRGTVGSDAPDANPKSDLEADAERRRQETDAEAERVARGGRDGSRPTGPTGPDQTPEPASGGTDTGGSGGSPSSDTGGGRDGSRPTGPTGPDDTPEPVPDTGDDGSGGRGRGSGGRDGSRPTGPTGPDDTPEPVPDTDTSPDRRSRPSRDLRDRRRDGSRPTGIAGPEDTPEPAPYPDRQGIETGEGAIADQASALEQRTIAQTEGLSDASEVRVIQQGDRLVARLTDEGRASLAERQSREVAAAIAPAAAAVAADPGRGRSDPNEEVAQMSDVLDEMSATSRGRSADQDEQFGDFRLGIPGTDRTLEGITRDLATGYSEAVDDFTSAETITLPTGALAGAGSITISTETNPFGRFARGEVRGAAALGNVPAATRGLDEGLETAGYLSYETVQGRGDQAFEEAGSAAEYAAIQAAQSARENPFEFAGQAAGSLVASAGIIGGASRVSSTAGRAAAYAIQPGEELASTTLSRAFPGVAERFPGGRIDNEEIVLREVQRAGSRIRSLFRSGRRTSSGELSAERGINIPRMGERGQFDLGSLSRDESVEITSEDLDVERRGDPTPGERPRADEPAVSYEEIQRTRERRTRERDLTREAREMEKIRESLDNGNLQDLIERQRARTERAQEAEVTVEEELVGQQEDTSALAQELGVETESEMATESDMAAEIGRLEYAQQPAVQTGVDLEARTNALAEEIGVVSQGDTELGQEGISEFDLNLETQAETDLESEAELEQALSFELEFETESETEVDTYVDLETEFESELFGGRRRRTPDDVSRSSTDVARRLLTFDVAGVDEVLGR